MEGMGRKGSGIGREGREGSDGVGREGREGEERAEYRESGGRVRLGPRVPSYASGNEL